MLNEEVSIINAAKEQNEIINKLEELANFILLEKANIANKNTQDIKKAKAKHKENIFWGKNRCYK